MNFTGTDEEWNSIRNVTFAAAPANVELEEPEPTNRYSSWSSSNGSFGGSFAPKDHPHKGWSGGGGGGYSGGVDGKPITYPESYICHILAGQFSSQMTLLPAKGGAS